MSKAWQEVPNGLWKHGLTRNSKKEVQTRPQQNTKNAQRRCKEDSKEAHRRYRKPKEDSKKNQRRLAREPEAHKRFKRGLKESERSSKEAASKLKGGPRKIKRRPKEGREEIQTRLKGGSEQAGGMRKIIDERSAAELGKCQVAKLNFQCWFPKFGRATANLLCFQQWQKKQIRVWFSASMTELQHNRQIILWVSARQSVWKTPKQGQSQNRSRVMEPSQTSAMLELFFFLAAPSAFRLVTWLEAYSRTSGESNHHRQSVRDTRVPQYQLGHEDTYQRC